MSKKRNEKVPRGVSVRRHADGKLHLAIQHDAQGRPVGVTLSRPLFRETWQNDVAAAAAGTAHRLLAEAHAVAQAVALGRNVMAATSTIVDGALAQAGPGDAPACGPGCAHCCYQPVGVSPPEVFAIHAHLRATRTPTELDIVVGRIRAADDRGAASAPRSASHPSCPARSCTRRAARSTRSDRSPAAA